MEPLSSSTVRNQVFISYSQPDRKWLDRLLVHVRPLIRGGHIQVFSDIGIRAGADWRSEIQTALDTASIAVLLISVHFLASDFIMNEELPQLLAGAEERGTTILPVIVTPSLYETMPSVSRFQAVNPASKPLCVMRPAEWHKVLSDLAREIQRHVNNQDV
jgi:TIR domain